MVKRIWGSIEDRVKYQIDKGGFSKAQKKKILEFKRETLVNGGSLNTISGKLYFLQKISKISNKAFEDFTKEDFQNFLEQYKNDKALRYYKKQIRQFWRWINEGELPKSVRWIDPRLHRRDRKEDKKILSPEMKLKMLKYAGSQRNRTILMLMMETGARPEEIYEAKISWLEPYKVGNKNFFIYHISKGKTGARKIILIDSAPDVKLWLNNHPDKENPNANLFSSESTNRYGKPIGWEAIRNIFRDLKKKLKVKGSFSPYVTRRTRLTELGKQLTPHELKKFAGHSSIRTSDYYVQIKEDDVIEKILYASGKVDKKKQDQKKEFLESQLKPKVCEICSKENPVGSLFCNGKGCNSPLNQKAFMQIEENKEDELKEIKKDMLEIKKLLALKSIKA